MEIKKLASNPSGLARGNIRFEACGAGIRIGGRGPGLVDIESVVDDLKLPSKKTDQALGVVKAHQQIVRKLLEQARAELLQKMKEILSEEEFKDFKAALDRPGGTTSINVAPARR